MNLLPKFIRMNASYHTVRMGLEWKTRAKKEGINPGSPRMNRLH